MEETTRSQTLRGRETESRYVRNHSFFLEDDARGAWSIVLLRYRTNDLFPAFASTGFPTARS